MDRSDREDNKLSFQHFECEVPMEMNNCKNNYDPFTEACKVPGLGFMCVSCVTVTKAL